jgi:uncharacterized protein (TIGR03435 family)
MTSILAAMVALVTGVASAQDLVGNWQGTLQMGNGIRVVLKLSQPEKESWKGVIYNADSPGPPFTVSDLKVQPPAISFAIKPLDAVFSGTVTSDGTSMTGNLARSGEAHPLNLTHVSEENTWAIPQPPKPMPPDAHPKFEVVTIKPTDPNERRMVFTVQGRHVMAINMTVVDLIKFAYSLHPKQIVNAPDWITAEKFNVDGVPDVEGSPSGPQMRMLFQDALAQRFGLAFHRDHKELPAYALTVVKEGPKLTVTADAPSSPSNFMFSRPGALHVTNSTMADFCNGMQEAVMDKPVVDRTGLKDRYDFNLNWTPDQSQFAQMGAHIAPASDDPNAPPSLYTALQEQVGLKLEPTKASAEVLVIDHVEKPSAN